MHNLLIPTHDLEYFKAKAKLIEPKTPYKEQFSVNGYHFACVQQHLRKKPERVFSADEIMGVIELENGEIATIVSRPHDLEVEAVSSVIDGPSPLNDEERQHILDYLMAELETIAQYAGIAVELIVTETRKMIAPRGSHRTLFVVMGSVPPGLHDSRHATHLFGTPICKPNYRARLPSPTADVGQVVKNDLGEPIAQIVGQTIYLFLPLNRYGLNQLVDPTVRMFRRGLSLAWNALYAGISEASDALQTVPTADEYSVLSTNIAREIERLEGKLSEADEHIAFLQAALTEALGKRRSLVTTLAGTKAQDDYDLDATWETLQACPYLAAVKRSPENTLYYLSQPLTLTDETGVERYVGRLGLHIARPTDITVWSLENPHTSDIPHPHVNQYGDVCLGNVTQSVSQLLADMKEAEAATLVLRLLAEGYDPTLTEHKLSEWPTPEEWQRRVKSRHAPTPREMEFGIRTLEEAGIAFDARGDST